jgi:hypothetical protein
MDYYQEGIIINFQILKLKEERGREKKNESSKKNREELVDHFLFPFPGLMRKIPLRIEFGFKDFNDVVKKC